MQILMDFSLSFRTSAFRLLLLLFLAKLCLVLLSSSNARFLPTTEHLTLPAWNEVEAN